MTEVQTLLPGQMNPRSDRNRYASKEHKDQRRPTKNANKPKGKCYNYKIKGHYACECRKPKKDNYQTAAATSKDNKKPKKEKPETRTSKTKEIHSLVKNVNKENNSNDGL